MNTQEIRDAEDYLGTRFETYFQKDWEFKNLCPCEVMRCIVLEANEEETVRLINSMNLVAYGLKSNEHIKNSLDRIGMVVSPESYGVRARGFWEELMDCAKYVGKEEKAFFVDKYFKDRGSPLLDQGSIDMDAVAEFPLFYEVINECFSFDCILESKQGYAELLNSYLKEKSESQLCSMDKELRSIYYTYGNQEALRHTLVAFLGLRYNLNYYAVPSHAFLAVVIENLNQHIQGEDQKSFER